MPKSSRHKSHKQSKHSSKDLLSDSEDAVKLEEKNNNREVVAASARGSIESSHLSSGEKRKLSSSFQSKEGKDLSYSEENVSSKVRKDKVERITDSGDRWTAGGDEENGSRALKKEMCGQSLKLDVEKGLKSRDSKGSSAMKSKSSRQHESEVEEHRGVSSVLKGKDEENRNGSTRCDSKRKSDKDSCGREGRESRDTKEKERVSNRDSEKTREKKQESEARVKIGSVTKKRDSPSEDVDKDRLVKRGKENSVLGTLDELSNPESVKELEKRIHRKVEGSGDRYKHEDGRESDFKKVLSKGDPAKDGKHKDERYKAENHKEKYQDNKQKNNDSRDDKYREHAGGDRDSRRRDDKHRDGSEREHRREDRHRDDVDRDFKHRKDNGVDAQLRGDKYREDNGRDNKHRDDKYLEGGKDNQRESRYYEDGDRVGLKDEDHRRKNDRHIEEKRREDHEKDSEIRDGRHGDKYDKERRVKERDRSGDKFAATNLREDTFSSELLSRKSGVLDNSPSYDDRSRLKGGQGRKRTSDKDDYIELKPRGFKDQRYDVEKRSTSDARVDQVNDRGRSGSRYADVEATSIRNRHSPSSSSHVTRDQYRLLKQEDMKYREYAYEDRVEHNITSTKEYCINAGVTEKISLSQSSDVIPKDANLIGGEVSAEKRIKSDTRNSPTSGDKRHYGRSHFRPSDDVEESGHKSGGSFKEMNSHFHKDGRGTHDMASETCIGDEKTISETSPYPRNSNLLNNSRSFSHPFPSPFRSADRHYNNRRNGDPNNMVRVQGSPWKGLPNWPSPLPNGFMPPFPLGPPPPPVGFHPSMQLFPGMRPSMELNHHHPYPIPDNACHVGWRTPVYDPRPPLPPQLHGWDANDYSIGGESHFFVRQQHWHHGGAQISKHVVSLELPPGSEKDVHNLEGLIPHNSQSNEEAKKDEQTTYRFDEFVDAGDNIVTEKIHVASEEVSEEEVNDVSKMAEKNDGLICHVYLSMLDISKDLVDPDLYSRFNDMVVNEDEKMISDSDSDSMDDKILYVEVSKDKLNSRAEILNDSLFPTIGDSLFQKAMSLYNKHREGFMMKEKESGREKVKTRIEADEESNEIVTNYLEILSEEKSRCNIDDNAVSMESGELPSRSHSFSLLNVVSNKAKEWLNVVVEVDDDDVVVGDFTSDESVKISRIHHSPENTH